MRPADFTRIIILAGVCLIGAVGCASKDTDPDDTPDISVTPMDPDATKDVPAFRAEDRHHRELQHSAVSMYRRGRRELDRGEWKEAVKDYDKLIAKFPFTDYAIQGAVERIYALYRGDEPDEAESAADRFVREHPRHAEVDYVTYLHGLVDSSRDDTLYDLLPLDNAGRDVDYKRHAYEDFALLIQRFPKSPYVGDARLRMIDLRNHIAAHDLSVARFYLKRGAYVAAARRAQEIIQNYPGAPGALEALAVLREADEDLGLKDQTAQVEQLIAANQNLKPIATVAFNNSGGAIVDMSGPRLAPAPRPITDADVVAANAALPVADRPGFFGRTLQWMGLRSKSPEPIPSSPTVSSTDATPAQVNSSVPDTSAPATPAPTPGEQNSSSPSSPSPPSDSGAKPSGASADPSSSLPPVAEASHGFWSHAFEAGGSAGAPASAASHGIAPRTPPSSDSAPPAAVASPSETTASSTTTSSQDAVAAPAPTPPAAASSSGGGVWSGIKNTLKLQSGGSAANHPSPSSHGIVDRSSSNTAAADRAQAEEKADAAQAASGTTAASLPDTSGVPHVHFLDRSENSQGPASAPSPQSHGVAPRLPVTADANGANPSSSSATTADHSDSQGSSGSSNPVGQPSPATHGVAPRIARNSSSASDGSTNVASASSSDPASSDPSTAPSSAPKRGFFQRLADFFSFGSSDSK